MIRRLFPSPTSRRFLPLLLPVTAACGGSSDVESSADDGETPVAGCSDGTLSAAPALYRDVLVGRVTASTLRLGGR